jgi:hypothetical protein
MKEKTGASAASPPKEGNKFKSSSSPADKLEDSIAESASLSASGEKRRGKKAASKAISESQQSYETDTFEDQSASQSLSKDGSAKKGGINYWPGAKAMEGSLSASKDASVGEPEVQVVTVDAMAEYMKK